MVCRDLAVGVGSRIERIAASLNKTMNSALDETGRQTYIMSVIGHEPKHCYVQKK